MVLQGGPCGRVGHRRTIFQPQPPDFVPGVEAFSLSVTRCSHRAETLGARDRRRCGDVQQMTTAGPRNRIASDTTATAPRGALVELGIGRGDEVIVPSFGPGAPADAVRLAGATPAFADIDAR